MYENNNVMQDRGAVQQVQPRAWFWIFSIALIYDWSVHIKYDCLLSAWWGSGDEILRGSAALPTLLIKVPIYDLCTRGCEWLLPEHGIHVHCKFIPWIMASFRCRADGDRLTPMTLKWSLLTQQYVPCWIRQLQFWLTKVLEHVRQDAVLQATSVQGLNSLQGVLTIAAGHAHSCVVLENHEVLTWGCGKSGKLGHGDGRSLLQPERVRIIAFRVWPSLVSFQFKGWWVGSMTGNYFRFHMRCHFPLLLTWFE